MVVNYLAYKMERLDSWEWRSLMGTYEWYRPSTSLGAIMTLLGIVLVLVPYLIRYAPEIEKLPPIILYIYRRNNFIFATPIVMAITITWALVSVLTRYWRQFLKAQQLMFRSVACA
jgi:hypothetical protein